jgi:uncharacterized protein (TIGR03435 family)
MFLEAVREQLGMKLKPAKSPLNVLVIDAVWQRKCCVAARIAGEPMG